MPLRLRRRLLEQASSSPLHNDVQIGRICSNLAQIIATTQFVDLGRMGSFPLVDLGITDPSATWCPFEVLGTWIKTSLLTPTPTPTLTPYALSLITNLIRSTTFLPPESVLPRLCGLVTVDLWLTTRP